MTPFLVAVGLLLVSATAVSMIATVVVPRGGSLPQALPLAVIRVAREAALFGSRIFKSFERKDGFLAALGPVSLLAQLAVFLGLFLVGYAIALAPWSTSFPSALAAAGSSMLTLGLVHGPKGGNDALDIAAAATGATAIALQVGYLPTIYQAFNRRESLVTLMESRSGVPSWGPELLARHQLIHTVEALGPFYADWEGWAADVAETHISYPVLVYFRSPAPWYSWVLALLATMDAAAMQLALCPGSAPSSARFCLRMGFTALRRIGTTLRLAYEKDPLPEGPIALSFEEFTYAVGILEEVGFPLERNAEEAWPHFVGWRVNYESLAYALADLVLAPRAPWSGPRRALGANTAMPDRPPHRSPDGRLVYESKRRPDS